MSDVKRQGCWIEFDYDCGIWSLLCGSKIFLGLKSSAFSFLNVILFCKGKYNAHNHMEFKLWV